MTKELNFKESFTNFVNFNTRNKRTLLSLIFIFVLVVILFQKFKPPYYETKAICKSGISEYEREDQVEDLSQRTAIDLINHLQINIENGDFKQVAQVLGVKPKVAATIRRIEAEQLYQKDMEENFYALNKFEISLSIFDNTKISDIENGLIYYFENNKFIHNHHKKWQAANSDLIEDINREINLLDKVRFEGAKNNLDVSSVNIVSGKEGKAVSNQILELSNERETIEMQQELLRPLDYVQGFANVDKKEDDILVWSFLGSILGYFFALFVALIMEVKNK